MSCYTLSNEQKKALTRKAKRILRKARLPKEMVDSSYIWSGTRSDRRAEVGNYVGLRIGNLSNKAFKRLTNILPHLKKELKKTAVACKFYNGLGFSDHIKWPFAEDIILF